MTEKLQGDFLPSGNSQELWEGWNLKSLDQYIGCLVGLAVGDALGATLEFKTPGDFQPINDMVGGGPHQLSPGRWTDDTAMALCLADSLIKCRGFNAQDQMNRYLKWYREGYHSSMGYCFDIGNTTRSALTAYQQTGEPLAGPVDANTAGNGSLMRLAPVPLYYMKKPEEAIKYAGESSRTTHGTTTAVDACRYYGGLLVGALMGLSKEHILAEPFEPVKGLWQKNPLHPLILEIAQGSYKQKNPPEIRGTGYVVNCLEAALWAFYHSNTFSEGALLAVNLGEDADSTGAVYGQLAGAYYGIEAIPAMWRTKLYQLELITDYATKLYSLSR